MKTSTETLDYILKVLYERQDVFCTIPILKLVLIHDKTKIEDRLLKSILLKLVKDGYADNNENLVIKTKVGGIETHSSDEPQYLITFEGRIFHESGGYAKASSSSLEAYNKAVKLEKQVRLLTWVTAIGAGGLLLLEIIKFVIARLDLVWCNCT